MEYYLKTALGSWLRVLREVVDLLTDPQALAYIGFDVGFETVNPALPLEDSLVLAQDSLAERCLSFAVSILYERGASMSWHSASWPGLLALFCSDNEVVIEKAVDLLEEDVECLKQCKEKETGNLFFTNLGSSILWPG